MYIMTDEKKFIDGEEHIVYGIYYDDKYKIADISTDKEKVGKMVDLFNKENLSPCHLHDVVYDMIG